MLSFLKVTNLAVIESAELEFRSGFIGLTGETGAGKSLIVDALGALSGKRVSGDWVRTGADKATVEGVFHLPEKIDKSGFDLLEEGELILRREIFQEGRSRAFINGVLVPNKLLGEYADLVFEIHGQHGQQELLKDRAHLGLYDRQVELLAMSRELDLELQGFWGSWKSYWRDVEMQGQHQKELEFLLHQISEIDKARLNESDDDIEERLKKAENATWIRETKQELVDLIGERLLPGTSVLLKKLEGLKRWENGLAPYVEDLMGLKVILTELDRELVTEEMDAEDERTIDTLMNRQNELNQLFFKYGRDREAVEKERKRLEERRLELEGATGNLSAIWDELQGHYKKMKDLKGQLDELRLKRGPAFEDSIEKILKKLSFPHAEFKLGWTIEDWPQILPSGSQLTLPRSALTFLFSPNAGETPRPLQKIASGGELSRVMLALIVSLQRETSKTLVFDEVDAGLGGETANLVGEKLAQLGGNGQVLCVTHLAQVAQFASQHWKVDKVVSKQRTKATFTCLTRQEKPHELARLLGGDPHAEGLLSHAREMVEAQKP